MPTRRLLFLGLVLCLSHLKSVHGGSIEPMGYQDRMELRLHGKTYTYYSFSETEPVKLRVQGPAQLTLVTRLLLSADDQRPEEYHLSLMNESGETHVYILSGQPSSKAEFAQGSRYQPGRPKRIVLSVPQGTHWYSLTVGSPKGALAAVHWTITRPWEWRVHAALSSTYDDNVYRYSPQDIDDFVHRRADHRFQMETYDDLVSSPSLTLSITRRFSQDCKIRLRLKYGYNLYSVNHQKNYQTFSAFLRTTLVENSYFQIGWFHLPKYLIRPYWDPDVFSTVPRDPESYKKCDFTRTLYAVKLGHRIHRSVRGAVFYERDLLYYNPFFTEYDTGANAFGFEIRCDVNPWLQTTFAYAFKKAEAKGHDEVGESKASSDDSDISYDEDLFGGSVQVDLSRHVPLPLNLTLGYQLARRYFTTEKSPEEDPFHAGRQDDIHRLSLTTEYDILRSLSLYWRYELQRRDVSSGELERITEVKNYHRHRFAMGIEFTM
jgi:hypothetical protein